MTQPLLILVGTMSGTAEMVADIVAEHAEDAGFKTRIARMEKVSLETLANASLVVICTSTYGAGEVPDNAKALYAALGEQKPDFSHIQYGVISLGDMVYPDTFAYGGKLFDERFAELGAKRIGERLEHDARGKLRPDDAADDWAPKWLELAQAATETA